MTWCTGVAFPADGGEVRVLGHINFLQAGGFWATFPSVQIVEASAHSG